MLFRKLLNSARRAKSVPDSNVEYPLEVEEALNQLHARAPVDQHLQILFDGAKVGDVEFAVLYRRCLKATGTKVTPFNVFQRYQSRQNLVQYFLASMQVAGARAECGVYRGATALLLCHAWRSRETHFDGSEFYLIDSFAGSSDSGERDLIPVREGSATRMKPFFPAGKTDTSPQLVRSFFGEFPKVEICAGWIPPVLDELPPRAWSFVHLDVTLYEPTLAALEYFYPRLSERGVILCDDYGSIFCPGSKSAWDSFCTKHGVAFITLGNRQSVIIKAVTGDGKSSDK